MERKGKGKNKGLAKLVKEYQDFSDKMIVYRGPIMSPGSEENVQEVQSNMFSFVGVITSGAGVINTVYPIAPSSFSNYAALFANYDEWRLLALKVEYVPNCKNFPVPLTTNTWALMQVITWAVDRDSAAAYTGYTGTGATFSTNNASCRSFAPNERSKLVYRMNGSDAAAWNTSAATNQLWIKMYSSGLSINTTYGYSHFKALFQFRGRT